MKKRIQSEFKRIGELVQASGMPDDDKLMAVGCLRRLPALCEAFCESYESRDVEEILRLERGMLGRLAEPNQPSPNARELAKVLSTRLKNLHERLGLPQLNPSKPRPVAQVRSRNTA
jgi:hypothetical protein